MSLLFCVHCSGPVLPVTYGLPTPEALNDPDFYSGGCSIEIGQEARYFCKNCDLELTPDEVKFKI